MKKSRADLARGLLRKSDSDLDNARTCLAAGRALDTICFHAQQAAEKALKAYLVACDVEFPFIHSWEKLIAICAKRDASFAGIKGVGQGLTPYAVELRYDDEFWPSEETAREALDAALAIVQFVGERLPEGLR